MEYVITYEFMGELKEHHELLSREISTRFGVKNVSRSKNIR